jgi:hypothetical protein
VELKSLGLISGKKVGVRDTNFLLLFVLLVSGLGIGRR